VSPTEKIAQLNDKARKGLLPGSTKMLLTRMVAALPEDALAHLRAAVAQFDAFNEDNDPHGERDFGSIELEGGRRFWTIAPLRSPTTVDRARGGTTGSSRSRHCSNTHP
jgi:hypothetical protein